MTNQSTINKLIEMRLTTMADAFRNQINDPAFKEVSFEDQFGMLVDIELTDLLLANIYLNTGIFLLPVLQAVVKLTWPVPLAWRPVNSISTPDTSVFLTC